jgi:hypothetical protein
MPVSTLSRESWRRVSLRAPEMRMAMTEETAATATKSAITAAPSAASAGLRRPQRQNRSRSLTARARIGSQRRKRRRSAASSAAVA